MSPRSAKPGTVNIRTGRFFELTFETPSPTVEIVRSRALQHREKPEKLLWNKMTEYRHLSFLKTFSVVVSENHG